MSDVAWRPAPDASAATNVGRFMTAHGIGDIDELRARSVADPEWFWAAVVDFLGLRFATGWTRVLDTSKGIPWATWFTGSRLNLADNCLRHPSDRPAIVWEGEDGDVRTWTYGELAALAGGLAAHLRAQGVGPGDRVGIFMPMVPETVAAVLGCALIGAVWWYVRVDESR